MKSSDFHFLAQLLKQHAGMVLPENKSYLIETRLMPIARTRSMTGPGELIDALRSGQDRELASEVIEAMSTSESFFFRDWTMFERLRSDILPRLLIQQAQTRSLRIWSAACSTGQEPYSVAMVLSELAVEFTGWQVEILATDLSRENIRQARSARYSQFDVQRGLPIRYLLKYFEPADNASWRIEDAIRDRITFREANLLDGFEAFGDFDLILCRNVLVHFDAASTRSTLERIARVLLPGGYLFLGGAESVVDISQQFKPTEGLGGFYCHTGSQTGEVNLCEGEVPQATLPPTRMGRSVSG